MWWLLALISCGEVPLETCDACDGTCSVESFTCESAAHVPGGVAYDDLPPTCGDHDPCWAAWGVHAADPGAEHWVHNLEHGGVVFLYDCPDGCDDEVARLSALVADRPDTLLAPSTGLPTRFAAIAWGWRWLGDCLDEDAMAAFYDDHRDQAPESLDAMPPESCTP